MKVAKALVELNIQYQQEYTFDNLYLHEGWPLRFDFAILHQDKIIALIECQGEQHYYNIDFFEDETLHLRDKMKKEFCEKNNIPLIEIPYTDYDKIDTEYIRRVMNYER